MERKGRKTYNVVKDKSDSIHTNTAEVLQCWKYHFEQHL